MVFPSLICKLQETSYFQICFPQENISDFSTDNMGMEAFHP